MSDSNLIFRPSNAQGATRNTAAFNWLANNPTYSLGADITLRRLTIASYASHSQGAFANIPGIVAGANSWVLLTDTDLIRASSDIAAPRIELAERVTERVTHTI